MSSAVSWPQQQATVSQVSDFPQSATTSPTTTITVDVKAPTTFSLKVRVPAWASSSNNSVLVNGEKVPPGQVTPGAYLDITRQWKSGDTVACYFPLSLWASHVQDDRPDYNATVAFM